MANITAVVLAGGRGKRMMSESPKVLHKLDGIPMIFYTLRNLDHAGFKDIIVVVGYRADEVKETLSQFPQCRFAIQEEPLGTGDAVKSALPYLNDPVDHILVVNGDDSAFYQKRTLEEFVKSHLLKNADVSLMTTEIDTENSLGRIIRAEDGGFKVLLEGPKYRESGYKSNEIVCGAYIFRVEWIKEKIKKVERSETGEYYITSLINIAKEDGSTLNIYLLPDKSEWFGINTQEDLTAAQKLMEEKNNHAQG